MGGLLAGGGGGGGGKGHVGIFLRLCRIFMDGLITSLSLFKITCSFLPIS